MAYWIFKVAAQELYPDIPGEQYVFDNTHSTKVSEGDVFLYLDKRQHYSFTASGTVGKISARRPTQEEAARSPRVRTVFVASLQDVVRFISPFSIEPGTSRGRINRARLGIVDVNLLGWSQSMPKLGAAMYDRIMDMVEQCALLPAQTVDQRFLVPDKWGKVKIRRALKAFTDKVLARSAGACVVCGTSVRGIVDAAHLSSYATDQPNRANPANGVGLCKFCHGAFDLRLIAIRYDGELVISPEVTDAVAKYHFAKVDSAQRKVWLQGVDRTFVDLTLRLFREANPKLGSSGAV